MGCPREAIWWRVAGGCHRAAPTALHGVSAGKPRHRRALSRSAPSKAQGRSTARNPRARPSHAVKATAWGHGHSEGTRPQRGDAPPARSPKPPNQKSASAPKAGRCAGTAPEQGVSWLFSVLVPKHWSCGARRLLFDFLFQKEDRRAQAPGRRPSQPELPWASPLGTSSHLSPPKLETACFVWVIFAFFFLEWLAGAVLARGWHRLPTRGSARARVRTMLHLVQEGYCRHFYNIYNCT